jgi:hypothetical protein
MLKTLQEINTPQKPSPIAVPELPKREDIATKPKQVEKPSTVVNISSEAKEKLAEENAMKAKEAERKASTNKQTGERSAAF